MVVAYPRSFQICRDDGIANAADSRQPNYIVTLNDWLFRLVFGTAMNLMVPSRSRLIPRDALRLLPSEDILSERPGDTAPIARHRLPGQRWSSRSGKCTNHPIGEIRPTSLSDIANIAFTSITSWIDVRCYLETSDKGDLAMQFAPTLLDPREARLAQG
jgi:hypothetical protein